MDTLEEDIESESPVPVIEKFDLDENNIGTSKETFQVMIEAKETSPE